MRPLAINNFTFHQMSCFSTFFSGPTQYITHTYTYVVRRYMLVARHCCWCIGFEKFFEAKNCEEEEEPHTTGQKLVTMRTTTTTTMKTFTLKAINLNGRHCLAFAQRPKIAWPQTFCIHFTIDCYRTLHIQDGSCSILFFLVFFSGRADRKWLVI